MNASGMDSAPAPSAHSNANVENANKSLAASARLFSVSFFTHKVQKTFLEK